MPRIRTLTSLLIVACAIAGTARCDDNAIAPDAVALQVLEGTRNLPLNSLVVVPFQINQAGTLRSTVDWNNFGSDLDTAIMLGTCTADQINQGGVPGCPSHTDLVREDATALGFDDTVGLKPSFINTQVSPGPHTLVVWNFSAFQNEVFFYRIEVF